MQKDGTKFGLCDSDTAFTYGGVTYQPIDGAEVSALAQESGTEVGNVEVTSLRKESLNRVTVKDLIAGRYETGRMWLYEFDYVDPSAGPMILGQFRLSKGTLGEVMFTLQELGIESYLKTTIGNTIDIECYVKRFGDKLCDPLNTGLRAAATFTRTVCAVQSLMTFDIQGDTNVGGYYNNGDVNWTGGLNSGLEQELKIHSVLTTPAWSGSPTYARGDYVVGSDTHVYYSIAGSNHGHNPTSTSGYWQRVASDPAHVSRITLKTPMTAATAVGDTGDFCFGCARTEAACQSVANADNASGTNIENHHGFPRLPNPDQIRLVARQHG